MVYGAKGDATVLFRLSIAYQSVFDLRYQRLLHCLFLRTRNPSELPHVVVRYFEPQIRCILDLQSIAGLIVHRFERKQVSYVQVDTYSIGVSFCMPFFGCSSVSLAIEVDFE